MRDGYLFGDGELSAVLEGHEQKMRRQIDEMDGDRLLNTSPEDLAEYYIAEFTIEVPVLDEDAITVDQGEAQVDVSRDPMRAVWDRSEPFYVTGTEVTFYVPFEGDKELFRWTPSHRYLGNVPSAHVREGELSVAVTVLNHNQDAVKAGVEREMGMIRSYIQWVAEDVAPFNDSLPQKVREHIERRRQKLLADRGLVGSLGFKMRQRSDASATYAAPPKRRAPPVRPPAPKTSAPFKPEPTLPDDEYERILSILSNMVEVMERSPGAFKAMKEEDLRTHFLVQLNAQYEGGATGETFNAEGKTDVLIRADGRTIFIAECKFWKGPKGLQEAIDQLLGYTSWRDTKTALLIFNRGRSLSDVLAKVPGAVINHPNFKRELPVEGETNFRYGFAHRDDPNRELTITVMIFETPS